jgi:hypothetical protein
MRGHQIRLHGPSGALEVEVEGETPQACLDRLQHWMCDGAYVELRTRRGAARINMAYVWAAEYVPSGRVIDG